MGSAHPVELRRAAVEEYLKGDDSVAAVAERHGVSAPSLQRWIAVFRRGEPLAPKEYKRGRPCILDENDLDALKKRTQKDPNASYEDLLEHLRSTTQKSVSVGTLRRALKTLGLTKRRVKVEGPREVPKVDPTSRYQAHHRRNPGLGRYPSSLTDAEWELLAPVFDPDGPARRGRPRKHEPRTLLDAIFYVVRTGCAWRMLPADFPPWETAYAAFRAWGRQGRFERMHRDLHARWRERLGRDIEPSAVIIDSQSAKTTEKGGLEATTARNDS